MRVFITGASGFIGRALYERYAADGHDVRGCDLVADPGRDVVSGDVGQRGAWQDHAAGCDLVIHTAATVSLRLERPDEVWRANVLGTAHALEAAGGGGATRFVHFSSVTAFGFDFPDGVEETYPVHTTYVPYPDTKIASEQVVLQAHIEGRISATIVRPGDVYGPRSRAWAVIPVELIKARRFTLPGGGRGIHSPVYIDNLVDGVVLAAAAPEAAGQIFTLSDGYGVPCREFFQPYADLVGRRLMTLPTPVAVAGAAVVQRFARFQAGDNDINPRSVR
jgi:nucleoside-diphosphate-sugar epimerase